MKPFLLTLETALMLAALAARGQGTMIYDQQSATNQTPAGGEGGAPIQQEEPMGQSFTPALSSVGFVQMKFDDFHLGNGLGATVYVLGDSITGTVLDSTTPVFMPDGFFFAVTNFYFPVAVAVVPGTTYYLQPVVLSGDDHWQVVGRDYGYPGGTFYAFGAPSGSGTDLWFREGYLIPEPPSGLLVLLAAGAAGICSARAQTTQTSSGIAYFSMRQATHSPRPQRLLTFEQGRV